jgi:predicted naringenin-chalcone synthase
MGVSTNPSVKLVSLAIAVPPYVLSQSDVAAAANRGFGGRYDDFERVARVFKSSGIRQRHARAANRLVPCAAGLARAHQRLS